MKVNSNVMGFVSGTKVLMADGSQKNIDDIQSGDFVLSFDQFDAFGKLEPKKVLNTFMHVDRNVLQIKVHNSGIELEVAPGQLFINSGSDWKEAVYTNEIIDENGEVHTFDVQKATRGKFKIFDIIVEENHSLIANGVRVHNKKKKKKAGKIKAESTDDLDDSESIQSGSATKKKIRRGWQKDAPKDAINVANDLAIKILSSVEVLQELVKELTPAELTQIKPTIFSTIDTTYDFIVQFNSTILFSSISTYDKTDVIGSMTDAYRAGIAFRDPFELDTVNAAGKSAALVLLDVMETGATKAQLALSLYVGKAPDKDNNKVNKKKRNGTSATKKPTQPRYAERQEGGARNDFGSDKGRGGSSSSSSSGPSRSSSSSKSPGSSTRSTGGLGGKLTDAAKAAGSAALSGGGLGGAAKAAAGSLGKP